MQVRFLYFWVICFFALSSCKGQQQFAVLDSESVDLLTDSRTLYINYWAVWCAPCIEEMPVLAEFRQQNIDRVEVYGVNFDTSTSEQLRADVKKLNVEIPILLDDPAELFGEDRPQALPTTWVVRDGLVVMVLTGPQTMESLLATL